MKAGVSLGSNVGDRLRNLRRAADMLGRLPGAKGPRRSSAYETEPVGCEPGTHPFLNAVVVLDWEGSWRELLEGCHGIEAALGRPRARAKNAPRTIDLDVLFVGDLRVNDADVAIPHPRMHLRRFVLEPLAELEPDLVVPGHGENVARLLARLGDGTEIDAHPF